MATLYLSGRCRYSLELLQELRRTNNESYRIVDIDRVKRHMLPPIVTAVPMAIQHDGRTLVGDELFDVVFHKPSDAPDPVYMCEGLGALLDDQPDEAANPASYMERFYDVRDEVPQDAPSHSKSVSLDAIRQQRDQSVNFVLAGQQRPL